VPDPSTTARLASEAHDRVLSAIDPDAPESERLMQADRVVTTLWNLGVIERRALR
jgi:hypothetical protein